MEEQKQIVVDITPDLELTIQLSEVEGKGLQTGGAIQLGKRGVKKLLIQGHEALDKEGAENGDLAGVSVAPGPTLVVVTAGGINIPLPLTAGTADKVGAALMSEADRARSREMPKAPKTEDLGFEIDVDENCVIHLSCGGRTIPVQATLAELRRFASTFSVMADHVETMAQASKADLN